MKKLKVISENEKRMQEGGFSPMVNPPLKKPLYTEDFIKKYLSGEGNQSLRRLESSGSQVAQKITPRKPPIARSKYSEAPTSSHATTMASYTSDNRDTVMPSIVSNSRNMQVMGSKGGNTQGIIELPETRRGGAGDSIGR